MMDFEFSDWLVILNYSAKLLHQRKYQRIHQRPKWALMVSLMGSLRIFQQNLLSHFVFPLKPGNPAFPFPFGSPAKFGECGEGMRMAGFGRE